MEIIRFVVQLYTSNMCFIHNGFEVTAGIRQGCHLSPLLFAMAADLLFKRLTRKLPSSCFKAYADDLAMATRNLFKDITLLEPLFEEYYLLSGLKLHYGKSVIVPLSNIAPDVLRDRLQASGSSWAGFAIRFSAKYLGYMMGPERGE